MKEQIYTIPLMDAYRADEECPFCFIERELEQHAMDFTLGARTASYMEDDVRFQTDEVGFCKEHFHKMFAYGNRLGSAIILGTHLKKLREGLKKEMEHYAPGGKQSLIQRMRHVPAANANNVSTWISAQSCRCYICEQVQNTYQRYMSTFFELFKRNDPEFNELMKKAKGYCLPHFGDILSEAERSLSEKDQARLREIIFPQMEENLARVQEDVDWFQKKFDYMHRDDPWKNSEDAVQRTMQKIGGGHPADPPYKQD